MEVSIDPSLQIDKACVLITEAGHSFGCSAVTMSKAMIFCHHYHKVRNDWDEFFQLFATAAFHLSVRICQEDLKMENIVGFFDSLGTSSDEPPRYDNLKAKIMEVEADMFRVVCGGYVESKKKRASKYTDPLDTAHRFVCAYMDQFSSVPQIREHIISVKTMSLKMLNTFYHCSKCTDYTLLELAWGAMSLAFSMYCINVDEISVINKEMSIVHHYENAADDMVFVAAISTQTLPFDD